MNTVANRIHNTVSFTPDTIMDACLIVAGFQGGTWAQHEPMLFWRKSPKSNTWLLLRAGKCVGSFVAKSKSELPAITPWLHENPLFTVQLFYFYPHDTRQEMNGAEAFARLPAKYREECLAALPA